MENPLEILQRHQQRRERSEVTIEEKTGKSWTEWERILEMTDITTANQQEFISDLKASFNLDGVIAALIVIHYKSKRGIQLSRRSSAPPPPPQETTG